jgi:purine-nucleoside phosphorylase
MIPLADHLAESAAVIRSLVPFSPEVTLVLGSGLGDFAERIPDPVALQSDQIPHYPRSTVEGHRGRLVFGTLHATRLLVLQGRVHFFETGYTGPVTYPLLLAHALGAKTLVLTNAAGGVNRAFLPGDLMLITDIINLTHESASSPVPQPSGAGLFDPGLARMAIATSEELGIRLQKGVYAGVKGPSYETAAEVEMIHRVGGDAVGMSTVIEAQLAFALGMRVLGISCITNQATGLTSAPLSHLEVSEVGQRVKVSFGHLIEGVIRRHGEQTGTA